MKVTITIDSVLAKRRVILFGARHNFMKVGFGNPIEPFLFVEFDEDYKNSIGASSDSEVDNSYSAFLMDCVKYNFRVQRINGEQLKIKIKGSDPVEYDLVNFNTFNPYVDEYEHEFNLGENIIEVELRILDVKLL